MGAELTLGQQKPAKQHMQQENEPSQGVGHHNGAGQGSYQAEEGQGVLMRQHEQEHEAEEPAINNPYGRSMSADVIGSTIANLWTKNIHHIAHQLCSLDIQYMKLQSTRTEHIVRTCISCDGGMGPCELADNPYTAQSEHKYQLWD